MMKLGFIGLGIMGEPMADQLRAAGQRCSHTRGVRCRRGCSWWRRTRWP